MDKQTPHYGKFTKVISSLLILTISFLQFSSWICYCQSQTMFNSIRRLSPSLILEFKTSESAGSSLVLSLPMIPSAFQHYLYLHLSFDWLQQLSFSNPSKLSHTLPVTASFLFHVHTTREKKPIFPNLPFEHLPTDSSSRTLPGHHHRPSPASAFQKGRWCCSTWILHPSDQRGPQ